MATRSTAALLFESVYGCVSKLVSGICLNVFAKLQGARRVWLTTSNTPWCDWQVDWRIMVQLLMRARDQNKVGRT